jgi:hypothetical protein
MSKYEYISAPEMTLTTEELQVGDILMTHGDRFLAEKIQHFMKVQSHLWYKEEMFAYFNHTATWIDSDRHTIGEAIASGYNLHPIEKYYDEDDINRMIVARPADEFTDDEKEFLIDRAEFYDAKNIKYEFTNFLWWVPYIYSKGKIDLSPKGNKANDKFFCFEASMLLWKWARRNWIDEEASKITTVSMLHGVIPDLKFYQLKNG